MIGTILATLTVTVVITALIVNSLLLHKVYKIIIRLGEMLQQFGNEIIPSNIEVINQATEIITNKHRKLGLKSDEDLTE